MEATFIAEYFCYIGKIDVIRSAFTTHQHPISQWLHSKEINHYKQYNYPKRKQEWLGGRICAKMATAGLVNTRAWRLEKPQNITIDNDDSGRPFLQIIGYEDPLPKLNISISHSGGLAAAIVSPRLCGIDIQEPKQTLVRVRERFCHEREQAMLTSALGDINELSRLSLLWAAKEAVRKCLSPLFLAEFLQLQLVSISPVSAWWHMGIAHKKIQAKVICGFVQEYGFGACLVEEEQCLNSQK